LALACLKTLQIIDVNLEGNEEGSSAALTRNDAEICRLNHLTEVDGE
jgi:hypothetical protein